jgi:hypothetical protein
VSNKKDYEKIEDLDFLSGKMLEASPIAWKSFREV